MPELMSLYDYLGRAAGSKLGAEVAIFAKAAKAIVSTRQVANKKYSGPVNLYERSLLDSFFQDTKHAAVIDEDKQLYAEKLLKKHANFLPKLADDDSLPF